MVRLISRQRGGLAALKLTKLFGINDIPASKDSGKVLIIIIYCYLIITIIIIITIWGKTLIICRVRVLGRKHLQPFMLLSLTSTLPDMI